MVELTVCWEENFRQAHDRKGSKKDYACQYYQRGQTEWVECELFPRRGGSTGGPVGLLSKVCMYMSLSRRKALQAAGVVGRTSLQASYTLWLSRDQQKFSRWTLVERPQSADNDTPSQQPSPVPPKGSQRDERENTCSITRLGPPQVSRARAASRTAGRVGRELNETVEPSPPRGLTNLGNTCLINSLAQCLLADSSLISFALSSIGDALAELKDQTHHHGKIVRPAELIRVISLQNPSLASGQQQDAAEALEVMLAGSQNSATHADQERGKPLTSFLAWNVALGQQPQEHWHRPLSRCR